MRNMVSTKCGGWSLQNAEPGLPVADLHRVRSQLSAEHGLHRVQSLVSHRVQWLVSVECGAWSLWSAEPGLHRVWRLVSRKCGAMQNYTSRLVCKVQSMVPQSTEGGLRIVHSSAKCGGCSATCGTSLNYPFQLP